MQIFTRSVVSCGCLSVIEYMIVPCRDANLGKFSVMTLMSGDIIVGIVVPVVIVLVIMARRCE